MPGEVLSAELEAGGSQRRGEGPGPGVRQSAVEFGFDPFPALLLLASS